MTDYHRIVIQRLAKKHLDRHREVLDKHKAKGPAFREAVEQLERAVSAVSLHR
jgi:hypothetical protein